MRTDQVRLRQLLDELQPAREPRPAPSASAPRAPVVPPGHTLLITAGGDAAILSREALSQAGIEVGEPPPATAPAAGPRLDVLA